MLRKICLVALCLLPVALCYSTAAPAPAMGTGNLAIVPAQCPIVIQVRGIDRVRERMKATLAAASPAWSAVAAQKLDDAMTHLLEGRKLQGLAPNGPVFFALTELPDGNGTPPIAVIARVSNYAEFRDGVLTEEERKKVTSDPAGFQSGEVGDHTVYFMQKQDFAVMTPSKETIQAMTKSYAGLDSKIPIDIAEQFTGRDVTTYVNMAAVNKVHGDSIRQFRDLILMAMQGGMGGMDENSAEVARKFYGGLFQLVLDSEVLVLTADFRPEGLAFQTHVRVGVETDTNGFLKAQKSGVMEPLAKLPAGQMMYFGASGLSPETMKAFLAMNAGLTKAPEGTGKALNELAEARNRATFGTANYPLSGVSIQEYEDAPRAMKATVSMIESIGEGGNFSGGFVKSKPEVKAAAQNYHDVVWTSYRVVWDFDKVAEMMPVGGDEMKEYMKKMMGAELRGWIGVSGNRVIQIQAKDWDAAKALIDSVFTSQNAIGSSAEFKSTRKELPQTASLIYLVDLGPVSFFMAESMMPLMKNLGAQFPMPEKLTPIKFSPAFVGVGLTLQPQQSSLDLFVPVSAVKEVSKLAVQFYMGAN